MISTADLRELSEVYLIQHHLSPINKIQSSYRQIGFREFADYRRYRTLIQ